MPADEKTVAKELVLPYLEEIGFPPGCVVGYGRVPVQVGRSVVWADYVCYYYFRERERRAFCVVEVKRPGENLAAAIPQAESYAQRLGAPFFCCTDGAEHYWYMTGLSQGYSVQLQSHPTLPHADSLSAPRTLHVSGWLLDHIRNFERAVASDKGLLEDCRWHHDAASNLNELFNDPSRLQDPEQSIPVLKANTMVHHTSPVFRQIEADYQGFLGLLNRLQDDQSEIEDRIASCMGGESRVDMPTSGPREDHASVESNRSRSPVR